MTINGYSSFEFEKQISATGNGDPNDSFDADLLDLVFNFYPSNKVRVTADVTWEHGSATENDEGNVALEYGFSEYTIRDWAKVRVGKFLTPFGIFNEIHTSKPSFLSVKEAASTNKPERIVSNAFRFFPRWGTGISLSGNFDIWSIPTDYDLLLSNGEAADQDTNEFEEDHDETKALTARIRFHPSNDLRIGFSYWNDPAPGLDIEFLKSIGFQLEYDFFDIDIIAEIVHGAKKTISTNVTTKQLGWFLQISHQFDLISLTPYLRIESIDPDSSASNDGGRSYILGGNWTFDEVYMIKIEYNRIEGDPAAQGLSTLPDQAYDELKAAIVVGF